MKISRETLLLLKNFSTINPGLILKQGNILSTIDPNKTVLAKATVAESFPKECAIDNLPRLLGVFSFLKEPDVEFQNEHLAIEEGDTKVKFRYGAATLITAPPNKTIQCSNDASFKLPSLVFQNVMKAQGAMQLRNVAIKGNDSGIFLSALDFKNTSGDSFDVKVAESNGHNFLALFDPTNLIKVIVDDYDVVFSAKGIVHLKSNKVEYWIPAEKDSSYT
jgi:hypothetical protein